MLLGSATRNFPSELLHESPPLRDTFPNNLRPLFFLSYIISSIFLYSYFHHDYFVIISSLELSQFILSRYPRYVQVIAKFPLQKFVPNSIQTGYPTYALTFSFL